MVTIELRVFETDKLVIEITNGQPNTSVCLFAVCLCWTLFRRALLSNKVSLCENAWDLLPKFTKVSKIYQNFKNLLKVIIIYQNALKFIENLPW